MLHYDVQSGGVVLQEMRAELAHLAHRCSEIDKYRVETCCIIGEFSLTGVLYFKRLPSLHLSLQKYSEILLLCVSQLVTSWLVI